MKAPYYSCACGNCVFYNFALKKCMKHDFDINPCYNCCPDFQRLRVKVGDKIKFEWMGDIVEQTVVKIHSFWDSERYEVEFPVKNVAHHKVSPASIIIDPNDNRRYTNVTVIWTEKS